VAGDVRREHDLFNAQVMIGLAELEGLYGLAEGEDAVEWGVTRFHGIFLRSPERRKQPEYEQSAAR
jgi:hypothetical protein